FRRVLFRSEKEKFTLRVQIKTVPLLLCLFQYTSENISWTLRNIIPFLIHQITEESCHLSLLRPPRQDCKCINVRFQINSVISKLFHPGNAVSVHHTFPRKRFLHLARRHSNIPDGPENVHKLQTYEFYIFFFDHLKNFPSFIFRHIYFLHLSTASIP